MRAQVLVNIDSFLVMKLRFEFVFALIIIVRTVIIIMIIVVAMIAFVINIIVAIRSLL